MVSVDIQEKVLHFNKFDSFNPMQQAALKKDLLEKSLVVSAPTASGKTVLAEIAALNSIINKGKKVIYTCPLRALASEHYNDFKKKYSKELGIKAGVSTGDFDSASSYLSKYDIIYTTYEKVDSLLRHKADWMNGIGLLVVDEIHNLSTDRGPTLEVVITKLRLMNPEMQTLALSATIPNAKELSKWLQAELIESDYRSVELVEGVYFAGAFRHNKGFDAIPSKKEPIHALVEDTMKKKKQALIFANTRKRSEGIAEKMADVTEKFLDEKEKAVLEKKSNQILNVLEQPTEQCRNLASLVKRGSSFHNAGLLTRQREIIEELFRENYLKILSATTTVAAGVNLPAFRVIVPSLYRYTANGNQRISVGEYKQMAGRSGRPKYDSRGEAILFASNELEADELMEEYVNGAVESVQSRLGVAPVLRVHLLSAIASNFVFDLASMEDFFSRTFYAHQYDGMKSLFSDVTSVLEDLKEWGFIKMDERKFYATALGKRVSELYLDPLTAKRTIDFLKQGKAHDFAYLYALADANEFRPLFSVPGKKEAALWEDLQLKKNLLPIDVDREMFSDADLLQKFNTALLLTEWITEVSDESIAKDFNVQPGILHGKLQISDWLTYCMFELSKMLELGQHLPALHKMRKRLKYGVREELIMLTELRGIGRVRARRLFNAGIRTIGDVKNVDIEDLKKIIPEKVALQVKEELKKA